MPTAAIGRGDILSGADRYRGKGKDARFECGQTSSRIRCVVVGPFDRQPCRPGSGGASLAVEPVTGFAREHACLVLCEVALEPSNEREPARTRCRPEGLPYRRAGLERLRSRCDEIFARTFTL